MKRLFLFSFFILASGCAKPKTQDVQATESLTKSFYATKVSATQASCYVGFYEKDNPSMSYLLEPEAMVACDGVQAQVNGTGYSAIINHPGIDPVKVTIIRPDTGTTSIDYVDLQ